MFASCKTASNSTHTNAFFYKENTKFFLMDQKMNPHFFLFKNKKINIKFAVLNKKNSWWYWIYNSLQINLDIFS